MLRRRFCCLSPKHFNPALIIISTSTSTPTSFKVLPAALKSFNHPIIISSNAC
jgi:hypothetical protein